MELPDGRLEIRGDHFGVSLGAVDGSVSEKFLDVADGSSTFDEVSGTGVAESMKGNGRAAWEFGSVVFPETGLDGVEGELCPSVGEPEILFSKGRFGKPESSFVKVAFQEMRWGSGYGNGTRLPVLGVSNKEPVSGKIKVGEFESEGFSRS